MKKALLLMLAMGLMIMGCVGAYNSTPGMMVMYGKYPECKNETAQADFVNCVEMCNSGEGRESTVTELKPKQVITVRIRLPVMTCNKEQGWRQKSPWQFYAHFYP